MNEIINIFENSMSLTITTIIAAIGVGLNVWFKKKAMGDPQREELIKSKFEIYKDMYLQIVLIKRSHCLNKSAREIDEIIKNWCEIIYVFLTIFLYLLKCPQSLIL